MAALRALIGPSQFDAVAYVRARTGDLGPNFRVTDAMIAAALPAVASEFSRWKPLGAFQVGNVYPPYTSPLVTVAGQERYSLTTAALAAMTPSLPAIGTLEEVEYLASLPMSNAGGEVPYNMLNVPNLGGGRYGVDPASPSSRVIRDFYNYEVDTYGVGFSQWGRDINGEVFFDLFPIAVQAGIPIFVRYTAQHPMTHVTTSTDYAWPTVPDTYIKRWSDLLWVQLLEDNVTLFTRRGMVQAGMIRQDSDAKMAFQFAKEMRENIELALGASTPVMQRT